LRDPERSCSFGAATQQDDQPWYQSKRLHFNAGQAMHSIPVTVQGQAGGLPGQSLGAAWCGICPGGFARPLNWPCAGESTRVRAMLADGRDG
jgi:hypothetical protein